MREANKKFLVIAIFFMAVAMLATPMVGTVMAMGPLKALEVGKNPNATGIPPAGLVMLDDVGPNNIFWINAKGIMRNLPDALKGAGRMNNAITADYDMVVDMQADKTLFNNKWIYLSGTGEPKHDGHGMVYWIFFPMLGPIGSAAVEQEYSDGAFLIRHVVGE